MSQRFTDEQRDAAKAVVAELAPDYNTTEIQLAIERRVGVKPSPQTISAYRKEVGVARRGGGKRRKVLKPMPEVVEAVPMTEGMDALAIVEDVTACIKFWGKRASEDEGNPQAAGVHVKYIETLAKLKGMFAPKEHVVAKYEPPTLIVKRMPHMDEFGEPANTE